MKTVDLTSIVQLIGSLGFPVAACLVMGWYVKYITDQNRVELGKLNDQHREEMNSITEALNNNTLALTELKGALLREEVVKDAELHN